VFLVPPPATLAVLMGHSPLDMIAVVEKVRVESKCEESRTAMRARRNMLCISGGAPFISING
jgi:hypothetical protein